MPRTRPWRTVTVLVGAATRSYGPRMQPFRLQPTSSAFAAPVTFTPARVMCAGICALVLTIGIARFSYTPLLPVMRDHAGLSRIDAGWLATINYVGYLGGALIASSIRTLQRKFILYRIGLIVAVATTAAMGLTTHVWLWLVLRLISGWSSTAGVLLGAGLALHWLLRRGHRPDLGILFGGVGLGMVVSGSAAAAMAGHLAWSGQWVVFGALGILFLVPAWAWMPAPAAASTGALAHPHADALPSRWWMALFHIAYFSGGFGYVITATFIVDIIRHLHSISVPGTWVWIIMGAFAIPSCYLWDRVADRLGASRALAMAYGLQTASFALLAYGNGSAAILLAALLYGATVMGTVSLTLTIIGRLYPANPAKAMARLTVSYGVAQIIGPIVSGYMAHGSGRYTGALLVATAVGVAGTAAALMLTPPNLGPAPATSSS